MGSNKHLKTKAIELRKIGKSYNEIRKLLGISSKGTLSHWFKDLKLSEKSKQLLQKNTMLAYKRGLAQANKRRTVEIEKQNSEAYNSGINCIRKISKNDLLLIGTALYWGEGTKTEKRTSTTLALSNSDPKMISVFMMFIRQILKIPEEKIRAGIHLYPTTPIDKAKHFWTTVTKLPENRFYIVIQKNRPKPSKKPFNVLPFGTAVIKINNRIQFYKIKGMINGIIQKLEN
jgi:hypothetical protein